MVDHGWLAPEHNVPCSHTGIVEQDPPPTSTDGPVDTSQKMPLRNTKKMINQDLSSSCFRRLFRKGHALINGTRNINI
jgi:hypothetical protein